MNDTATLPKQPKAKLITQKPATANPAGGVPSEKAVERIRVLTKQASRLDDEVQKARAALVEPEDRLRSQIHHLVPSSTNLYDIPVTRVWELFIRDHTAKNTPYFSEYQEANDAFSSVNETLSEKIEARKTTREELNALLAVEGPKLAALLREKYNERVAQTLAAFLPWCANEREAMALVEQTSRVLELQGMMFNCSYAGSDSAFINLWDGLRAEAPVTLQG